MGPVATLALTAPRALKVPLALQATTASTAPAAPWALRVRMAAMAALVAMQTVPLMKLKYHLPPNHLPPNHRPQAPNQPARRRVRPRPMRHLAHRLRHMHHHPLVHLLPSCPPRRRLRPSRHEHTTAEFYFGIICALCHAEKCFFLLGGPARFVELHVNMSVLVNTIVPLVLACN
jgi:hypothetical protein